jgi:hypothetical protein
MSDAAQRQRRLAVKAARRKAVVAEKKKQDPASLGLAGRVRYAATFPIARCAMTSNLFEAGIGTVLLARALPHGMLGCGFFLVDIFCLGVKDAFFRELDKDELGRFLEAAAGQGQDYVDADPACARKLVRDSVAYAARIGLPPVSNYNALEPIFGDIDAGECLDTFTFGRNGKPYYVSGPNDTPARIRQITDILQKKCGTGNWDALIEVPL